MCCVQGLQDGRFDGLYPGFTILMHIFKPNRGLFKDVPIVRRDALVGLKGLMDLMPALDSHLKFLKA